FAVLLISFPLQPYIDYSLLSGGDGELLESSPESRLNSAESQKLKSRADPLVTARLVSSTLLVELG
ncbi:unnamed protein product, partial [Lampetra planeri]